MCPPCKRKRWAIQPAKLSLFKKSWVCSRIAEELQFETSKLWATIDASKEQRTASFYRGKEEVKRGCYEQKFIEEKWEFEAVVTSHWLRTRLACSCCQKKMTLLPAGLCKLGQVQVHMILSWPANLGFLKVSSPLDTKEWLAFVLFIVWKGQQWEPSKRP